jgi:putative inorganic carbon (hco3(-)) transporter
MLARSLKQQWVPLACAAFVLLNTGFMAREQYWFNLLPVALLVVWALIAHVESVLLFIVFATPLSINLEQLELGGLGISLPTEPLMVAVMLLFLLKLGIERDVVDPRIWRHPVTVVIIVQLVWMLFCITTSSLPLVSLKYLAARLWFVTTMYFMATRLFQRTENMPRFAWAYTCGLVIVIGYTLIRHAGLHFEHEPAHWVMEPFFKDHTSYGAIIAFFLPFAVTTAVAPALSAPKRVLAVIFLAALVLGMIFSYTRAAWVGVAAALGVLLLMRFRVPAWLVLGSAVVLGGLYLVNRDQITIALERNRDESSDDLAKHVSSISNISSDASNLERLNRWNCAMRMFEERPWTGWGPGTYMFQYAPFQAAEDKTIISTNFGTGGNAHSEFLGPLAEQGFPGMLLVIAVIAATSWTAVRLWCRLPSGLERRIVGAAFFGLITYYVHGTLNNFLDLDKASVPFWGFTAMIVVLDLKYPQAKRTA